MGVTLNPFWSPKLVRATSKTIQGRKVSVAEEGEVVCLGIELLWSKVVDRCKGSWPCQLLGLGKVS